MRKTAIILIFLLCAFPVKAQSLMEVLSSINLHPIVGITANLDRQALVGPSWSINAFNVGDFHAAAGFTRGGFGPAIGYHIGGGALSVMGQYNALLFNKSYSEARFAAGLFWNL